MAGLPMEIVGLIMENLPLHECLLLRLVFKDGENLFYHMRRFNLIYKALRIGPQPTPRLFPLIWRNHTLNLDELFADKEFVPFDFIRAFAESEVSASPVVGDTICRAVVFDNDKSKFTRVCGTRDDPYEMRGKAFGLLWKSGVMRAYFDSLTDPYEAISAGLRFCNLRTTMSIIKYYGASALVRLFDDHESKADISLLLLGCFALGRREKSSVLSIPFQSELWNARDFYTEEELLRLMDGVYEPTWHVPDRKITAPWLIPSQYTRDRRDVEEISYARKFQVRFEERLEAMWRGSRKACGELELDGHRMRELEQMIRCLKLWYSYIGKVPKPDCFSDDDFPSDDSSDDD